MHIYTTFIKLTGKFIVKIQETLHQRSNLCFYDLKVLFVVDYMICRRQSCEHYP
jgi:hypothetical protein